MKASSSGRVVGCGVRPCLFRASLYPGVVQHLDELLVPAIEDRGRRLARGHEGIPVQRLETGIAGFRYRGHVGQVRRPHRAGGGQRHQLAGLDLRHRRRRCGKIRGHALAKQVLQCRCSALVGDMDHLDTGTLVEQFAGKMGGRAGAGRRVVHRPRLLLRQRDQFGQFVHAGALVYHQHIGKVHPARDWRQVLERIVGQLHQMRRDGQRPDRAEQQHAAIGRAARHQLVSDIAAGTAAVVDDDRLTEVVRQFLGDQSRGGIGGAAGGEAHHQSDRLAAGDRLRLRKTR